MIKTIKSIHRAKQVNMGGNIIDQPLPIDEVEMLDPFLLIHHWKNYMFGNESQRDVGVGSHPHRGFSPVTFIYNGEIRHQDSFGNDAIVGEGGTQWMFAGRGITHSERPSKKLAENGGMLELIQLWINTPAKQKMETAYYKPISKEDTPVINEGKSTIQVVCGNYKGVKGVVDYYIPLNILRVEIEEGDSLVLSTDKEMNTLIYSLDGELEVNKQRIVDKEMVIFNRDGDEINIKAAKTTRFIVLSGQAINEEVVANGPFVMNSHVEIMEAMRDTKMGKMGILIENFD